MLKISELMEELKVELNKANEDIASLAAVRDVGSSEQQEELLVLSAAIAKVLINYIKSNAEVIIPPHDNAVANDPGGTSPNQHQVRISRQKGFIR